MKSDIVEPKVPADILQRFDCVLVNPGGPAVRGAVLRKLRDAKRPKGRMPAVAIAARSDWTAQDLSLVRDRQFFVFFNRREVVQTADRRQHRHADTTAEQSLRKVGFRRPLTISTRRSTSLRRLRDTTRPAPMLLVVWVGTNWHCRITIGRSN